MNITRFGNIVVITGRPYFVTHIRTGVQPVSVKKMIKQQPSVYQTLFPSAAAKKKMTGNFIPVTK
ncbi:MAG: hypothetical protein ACXVPQ_04470 [Bacteroidia bacterium]